MSVQTISPFRTPDQREAERFAKREAVLSAAVDLFNERGFSATSLDDVAASLGVTKPVIYHYLGTKEQVLLECLTRGLTALEAAAHEAQADHRGGAERLRAFLIRYAEISMAPFGRCVVLTADHDLSPEALLQFRAMKRRVDDALRGLIAQGAEDGSLRAQDPALAAAALAGAMNWIPRWQDPTGRLPPDQVAARLVDILMEGMLVRS
ncbi:AcrR family transcriptional regulator [Sphingomonas vulcanisoli]|uniref:AcrR family transcriptional regulator n=1 Tax=Sphingomonas vulcanisoli TaxID=1658060 RepID=A0ABX0TSI4_9SPHN|nr:TetR/AcrR family transcriptional regulator [Sphingomonas vulcanisoli]NIJ07347.1 AcrR family transcriptional regulator [Sphingomonas vulcanisoli]